MEDMKKDIYLKDYLVSRIISFGKDVPGYGRVYYRTNEDLSSMYRDIDFEGKRVLSVLASSDQVFTARFLGAQAVDSFDKNRLTLYYYYLRKWSIKYRNELYPKVFRGNKWLKNLLDLVKVESEEEEKALNFFKKHVSENTNLYNLFYEDHLDEEKGSTLYSKASHIKDTIDMDMKFIDFDMFTESSVDDKYDIVLTSNILEWAREDKSKFMIAEENFSRMLNKDGLVVCSSLINRSKSAVLSEREIFDSNFECSEYSTGYIYRKK